MIDVHSLPIFDPATTRVVTPHGVRMEVLAADSGRYTALVEQASQLWPDLWNRLRSPETEDAEFSKMLGSWLHFEHDQNIGWNGKRLSRTDISTDVAAQWDETGPIFDADTGRRFRCYDWGVGAGSAGLRAGWSDVSGTEHSQGRWIQPQRLHGTQPTTRQARLGFLTFWLVDGVVNNRGLRDRLERHVAFHMDKMGCTYTRFGLKKGQRGAAVDFWAGLVQDEENLSEERLDQTFRFCVERNLLFSPTFFLDSMLTERSYMSLDAQLRLTRRICGVLKDYLQWVVACQYLNEGSPLGTDDERDLNVNHGGISRESRAVSRLMRELLGPDVKIAQTSSRIHAHADMATTRREITAMYGGPEQFFGRTYRGGGSDYHSEHLLRVSTGDVEANSPAAMDFGADCPTDRENGEPKGPKTSSGDTSDPGELAEHARRTKAAGWDYCFTSRAGIIPDGPEFDKMENAEAIATAVREAWGVTGGGGGGGGTGTGFKTASLYRIEGTMQRGGFVGPKGLFVRVDPNEPKGAGIFNGRPVYIDAGERGAHEEFELEPKGDGRFAAKHVLTGEYLGADATKHSGDLTRQYYMIDHAENNETFWMFTHPNGSVFAFIEHGGPVPFYSAPLTWVPA